MASVDGGVEIGCAATHGRIHRVSHEAMATIFEVHADHPDERYAAQAAQAAFDLADRLERELSRFQPNSDITRINHLNAGEATRVSAATLECLTIARYMYDLTGGAFDVSIGTGLTSLELNPHEWTVRASEAGVRVDLGGIGKGYAVDCMAELLEEWELPRALVHGGFSSVLALEPPAGTDGWPLTLSDPDVPGRVLANLVVRQTALAASGIRKVDHIVDPRPLGGRGRTGVRPGSDPGLTPVRPPYGPGPTVCGRRGAWTAVRRPAREAADADPPRAAAVADALTTAFMLLWDADIDALCAHAPGLEAWILDDGPDPAAQLRHVRG